jgi:hypothetical protein
MTDEANRREVTGDISGAMELRNKRRFFYEKATEVQTQTLAEESAKNQIDIAETLVARQEEIRDEGLAAEKEKWAKEKAMLDEIAAGEKVAWELRQAEKERIAKVWEDFDVQQGKGELARAEAIAKGKLDVEIATETARVDAFDRREQKDKEVNAAILASAQRLSQMTQQTIASGVSALVKGKKFEAAAAIEAIGDQLIQQSVADAFKATGMAILFNPGAAAMFALSAAELAAGTAMAAGGASASKGGSGAQAGAMGTDASRQYDQTTASAQPQSNQPIIINVSTLRPDLEAGRVIVDSIAEVRKRRGEYGVQY